MHQRIEIALVFMLCALMGFIAHNTIAASARFTQSDCWQYGYVSCCILGQSHIPTLNCPDDKAVIWICPSRIAKNGNPTVGTWYLAKNEGYSDVAGQAGELKACVYHVPLSCGFWPGTCFWKSTTESFMCGDDLPPSGEPDCFP
ncbi:MAG TPA: hypothetical protein PK400_03775 [Phycisphaerales bacterium]|nr:hypothetical protein [Phycisphaerales bacterium]HRQ75020.1 hypothetical protein [Phycisphaerales bacterium]